jgi:Phosphotransferase enzyme family
VSAGAARSRFSDRIEVDGQSFELISVRRTGVAVYRGDDAYLRLGPATVAEVATQRRMLAAGFPVAEILAVSEHDGAPYCIERSLGADTWGDLYVERTNAGGRVTDQQFWAYGDVLLRTARAQLRGERRPWEQTALADFLGIALAADHAPALATSIRAAFDRAVRMMQDLPGALQHDDLHPFNTCQEGVIDLEGVAWAVAGYDVVTAVLEPSLAEARWEGDVLTLAWFTEEQVRTYLDRLDEEFVGASAPPPSTVLDAYLTCRAISRCSRLHSADAVNEERRSTLAGVLPSFLDSGRVPLGMTRS